MHSHSSSQLLDEVVVSLQQIRDTAEAEFGNLSHNEINLKPSPDSWSVAECLEHLNYYFRYYNPVIKSRIEHGKSRNWQSVDTYQSTWIGRYSVNAVLPDNGKKMKTQKHLNPSNSSVSEGVLDEFMDHTDKLIQLCEIAQQVNLNKVRVPIEFARFLKIRLGDCLRFMAFHNERHLQQALRVKARIIKQAA